MWPGIAGITLAACALFFCAYLWLELRNKVSEKDISKALQSSSEDAIKTLEKSFRGLETEWVDLHAKIMKIAGRIDKTKGLEASREVEPVAVAPVVARRSDLIRNRNGRKAHVENVSAE